ncbi:hypothetical protein EK21DRAFT_48766, partial [Setomelanomma holmii]
KASAPLAQVLNEDVTVQESNDLSSNAQLSSTSPFSGKLVDLLLDTSRDFPNEGRRLEEQNEESSRNIVDSSVITLPQLPQRPATIAQQPRIPPLLQGLHQPPPLPPTGQRFPPITDGVSELERDICDRLQHSNAINETRNLAIRDNVHTEHDAARDQSRIQGEQEVAESNDKFSTSSTNSTSLIAESHVSPTQSRDTKGTLVKPRTRKRKIWTDAETTDLLIGVSRYGIGNWKRILHCTDFKFNGRTAVDLKDRFRVCCPGEGQKPQRRKANTNLDGIPGNLPRATSKSALNDDMRDPRHISKPPSLVKLGIQAPFQKSTRRPRQEFSTVDDENLLKGFKKHGPVWHLLRDDAELGFSSRHPTDLRDRFRIRYPEEFAKAGYKLKSKARPAAGEDPHQHNDAVAQTMRSDRGNDPPDSSNESRVEQVALGVSHEGTDCSTGTIGHHSQFLHSMSTLEGDPSNTFSNATDAGGTSLILNRNILQWAEANYSAVSYPPAPYALNMTGTHTFSDMSAGNNVANDGLHINPLATLKLPSMVSGGH